MEGPEHHLLTMISNRTAKHTINLKAQVLEKSEQTVDPGRLDI